MDQASFPIPEHLVSKETDTVTPTLKSRGLCRVYLFVLILYSQCWLSSMRCIQSSIASNAHNTIPIDQHNLMLLIFVPPSSWSPSRKLLQIRPCRNAQNKSSPFIRNHCKLLLPILSILTSIKEQF